VAPLSSSFAPMLLSLFRHGQLLLPAALGASLAVTLIKAILLGMECKRLQPRKPSLDSYI